MNSITQEDFDNHYEQVKHYVAIHQTATVSMLQRRFRIGYTSAAKMIDRMEEEGLIGPYTGSAPRRVFMPVPPEEKKPVLKTKFVLAVYSSHWGGWDHYPSEEECLETVRTHFPTLTFDDKPIEFKVEKLQWFEGE